MNTADLLATIVRCARGSGAPILEFPANFVFHRDERTFLVEMRSYFTAVVRPNDLTWCATVVAKEGFWRPNTARLAGFTGNRQTHEVDLVMLKLTLA